MDRSDNIKIDKDGKRFTAYIFADNYFEMNVNGIPVRKAKVLMGLLVSKPKEQEKLDFAM